MCLVTIIHFLLAYFWFYCFEDQCERLKVVKIYKNVMKEKNHFKFCQIGGDQYKDFDRGQVQCESNEWGQDQYEHFKSIQDQHERFESGQDQYEHFESGNDQCKRFESGQDQYVLLKQPVLQKLYFEVGHFFVIIFIHYCFVIVFNNNKEPLFYTNFMALNGLCLPMCL